MSLIPKLSLGYLASRLAKAIGWSPVERSVRIYGAEGPAANRFEDMVVVVKSVEGNTMIVEPDRTVRSGWREGARLRLTSRHCGWAPTSLWLRPIAVVLETEPSAEEPSQVAISMAAIVRKRAKVIPT